MPSGVGCPNPLLWTDDWTGYYGVGIPAIVDLGRDPAVKGPRLAPLLAPLPTDRSIIVVNKGSAFRTPVPPTPQTGITIRAPITAAWTVMVGSPYAADVVGLSGVYAASGAELAITLSVEDGYGPQGVLSVSSSAYARFYTNARSMFVTWALAVDPVSPRGVGILRLHENGVPVVFFTTTGGSATLEVPLVIGDWPTFSYWTLGSFTNLDRSIAQLVDARIIVGEAYSASKAMNTYLGNETCVMAQAQPPPAGAAVAPGMGTACVPLTHRLTVSPTGFLRDTVAGGWTCYAMTTNITTAASDGWSCNGGTSFEAIGPPFTIHVVAKPTQAASTIAGSAPLVTLSNARFPWNRATLFGIWLQPDGAMDVVAFVNGAPGVVREPYHGVAL